MNWFRWYLGTTEDGKFRMIARHAGVTVCHAVGVWAALLEDAAHAEHRGIATRGEGFYAAVLDLDAEQVGAIIAAMAVAGIVSCEDGYVRITSWNERQFETDVKDPTAAARQQRARDKRKVNDTTTPRHGSVTVALRPDTDTDTDTEKKETRGVSRSSFDRFWQAYPEKIGKGAAQKSFERAIKVTDIDTLLSAVARYRASKPTDRPWCNPATYLNQQRWADEPAPLAVVPKTGGLYGGAMA